MLAPLVLALLLASVAGDGQTLSALLLPSRCPRPSVASVCRQILNRRVSEGRYFEAVSPCPAGVAVGGRALLNAKCQAHFGT